MSCPDTLGLALPQVEREVDQGCHLGALERSRQPIQSSHGLLRLAAVEDISAQGAPAPAPSAPAAPAGPDRSGELARKIAAAEKREQEAVQELALAKAERERLDEREQSIRKVERELAGLRIQLQEEREAARRLGGQRPGADPRRRTSERPPASDSSAATAHQAGSRSGREREAPAQQHARRSAAEKTQLEHAPPALVSSKACSCAMAGEPGAPGVSPCPRTRIQ